MARRPRRDRPGMLHHVMNRALARRTLFESKHDIRRFLALLACEVRKHRIEVLAFAILTTHFHLLLRSITAELSDVLQRVENLYVRHFNRTRRRDGPLVRTRFKSKPVETQRYLFRLIQYFDDNAVAARLVDNPVDYRWCSAFHYARRRRPPWLATEVVDRFMGNPSPGRRRRVYLGRFGRPHDPELAELMERRLACPEGLPDDWDDLLDAAPDRVLDWMRRKARLADGTAPGLPYVHPARVLRAVEDAIEKTGALRCKTAGARQRDAWPVVRVGLLRDLAACTASEIGRRLALHPASVQRRAKQHLQLIAREEAYAGRVKQIAAQCLRSVEGDGGR